MMGIGFPELMIILVIIMIIFGAGKLPEIGSAFGRSIKNFKKSMKEAEEEGLDKIFEEAGLDWRVAGCSMCLGMNPDILSPGQRCASTSNRNFEGRQGKGGRTHLVSPAMAAAAAIAGHFVDVRDL